MEKQIIYRTIAMIILLLVGVSANAQEQYVKVVNLKGNWRFSLGDNIEWSETAFNDSYWERINVPGFWENQGFHGYDGYAWYRGKFDGRSLRGYRNGLTLDLGFIDDIDEVFFNGKKIGQTGTFPPNYRTAFNAKRRYPLNEADINSTGSNTIAVRVFDNYGGGGIVSGNPGIYYNEKESMYLANLKGQWKFKLASAEYPRTNQGHEQYKELSRVDVNIGERSWVDIYVPLYWESQGFLKYDGNAVYLTEFEIKEKVDESMLLVIGAVDDSDWVYLNGHFIGHTQAFDKLRYYTITKEQINQGTNRLVVYVNDTHGGGGICKGPVAIIRKRDLTRFIRSK